MPNQGYVYILFNSAMPSLVKIGQTTRDPEDRAHEIGGTGVPGRFVVAYRERVPDCAAVERRIHRELAKYRYDPKREFFELSLESAIATMRQIAEEERRRWILEVAPKVPTMASVSTTKDPVQPSGPPVAAARPLGMSSNPAVRSVQPSGPPVAFTRQPSWGALSGLLLVMCAFGSLVTVLAVILSIQSLPRDYARGDLTARVIAEMFLIGIFALVTTLLWKGARKLRSKGW
jgi:hypothetical protein